MRHIADEKVSSAIRNICSEISGASCLAYYCNRLCIFDLLSQGDYQKQSNFRNLNRNLFGPLRNPLCR